MCTISQSKKAAGIAIAEETGGNGASNGDGVGGRGGARTATTITNRSRMTSKGPTLVHLSSKDVPERDRPAVLREVFGRMVVRLDLEPMEVPLRFEMTAWVLPELVVSNIAFSPLTVRRTSALMADGNDCVRLLKLSSRTGVINVSHLGRELATRAGEAVLLSNADGYTGRCVGMTRYLGVSVPRPVLAKLVPKLEDTFVRPIPRNSEALKLLTRYVGVLEEGQELESPELCHAVVNHVHDLLSLSLGASRDAAEIANGRGLQAARLGAAKADILKNLSRQGFSVREIARHLGVTPRYVQKPFDSAGMTFPKFLLDQRLVRSHRMLTSPRFRGLSITYIAFEAGFGDLSHFNRSFRRRYGESPSDVRAAALRDGAI
jgi:AraC-like DNA-binding protein